MQFRYDFGQKLDLTKFIKQTTYYISTLGTIFNDIQYDLYIKDFIVKIFIDKLDNDNQHLFKMNIYETDQKNIIIPSVDLRFSSFKDIDRLFGPNYYVEIDSNSVQQTVDDICKIIKILHKISDLEIFI